MEVSLVFPGSRIWSDNVSANIGVVFRGIIRRGWRNIVFGSRIGRRVLSSFFVLAIGAVGAYFIIIFFEKNVNVSILVFMESPLRLERLDLSNE